VGPFQYHPQSGRLLSRAPGDPEYPPLHPGGRHNKTNTEQRNPTLFPNIPNKPNPTTKKPSKTMLFSKKNKKTKILAKGGEE
jgi:hypothetical protein